MHSPFPLQQCVMGQTLDLDAEEQGDTHLLFGFPNSVPVLLGRWQTFASVKEIPYSVVRNISFTIQHIWVLGIRQK